MATFYKRLEQQDEDDIIDIGPTVDTSVERVKVCLLKKASHLNTSCTILSTLSNNVDPYLYGKLVQVQVTLPLTMIHLTITVCFI